MSAACCIIGADPARYTVEEAYLTGQPIMRYSRAQVERHMAHSVDPAALKEVSDMATASGIAARLRQLELTAARIMDAALESHDGKLALAALKEARNTIVEMGKLSEVLSRAGEVADAKPELDAALWEAITGHGPPPGADPGVSSDDVFPGPANGPHEETRALPYPRRELES